MFILIEIPTVKLLLLLWNIKKDYLLVRHKNFESRIFSESTLSKL